MSKSRVEYEVFVETFRHVSAGGLGSYRPGSREFDSPDEASGYAAGLRTNPAYINVRVFHPVGARAK